MCPFLLTTSLVVLVFSGPAQLASNLNLLRFCKDRAVSRSIASASQPSSPRQCGQRPSSSWAVVRAGWRKLEPSAQGAPKEPIPWPAALSRSVDPEARAAPLGSLKLLEPGLAGSGLDPLLLGCVLRI